MTYIYIYIYTYIYTYTITYTYIDITITYKTITITNIELLHIKLCSSPVAAGARGAQADFEWIMHLVMFHSMCIIV